MPRAGGVGLGLAVGRPSSSATRASIAGHTTKPWRPCATSSARRSHTRGRHAGRSASGTTCDSMPARPAGSCRIVETSRSPKTVIATVRGIGVAVSTSTCGGSAALQPQRLALLDAEAVLLVDDDEPEVGERHRVADERVRADDDARLARGGAQQRLPAVGRRQLAGEERRHDRRDRSGPSMRAIERRCCAASTSVGASSADCPPESATASIARRATTVLPEPTSPCTSRFIGTGRSRSSAISAPTSCWSAVSENGSEASNRSRRPPADGCRAVVVCARSSARRCSSAVCSTNASVKRSVRRAAFQSASRSGRWIASSAAAGRAGPRLPHRVGHGVVDGAEPVEEQRDRLGQLPARERARGRVDRDRRLAQRLAGRGIRGERRRIVEELVVGVRELARARGSRPPCRRRCRGARAAGRSRATSG